MIRRLNTNRPRVTQLLSLLKLSPDVVALARRLPKLPGRLSERYLRERLVNEPPQTQLQKFIDKGGYDLKCIMRDAGMNLEEHGLTPLPEFARTKSA